MLIGVVPTMERKAKRGYRDDLGSSSRAGRCCSQYGDHRDAFSRSFLTAVGVQDWWTVLSPSAISGFFFLFFFGPVEPHARVTAYQP